MKRFWRCFVCNDVHYGEKSPEICPTCEAKKAYVEIASSEARKMCSVFEARIGKEEFRTALERFAAGNEFMLNPEREKVEMLLEGALSNEENHGMKYCPCRLTTKDFEEDLKLVCPCNFLVHKTYREQGECWCGLFVKR